MRPRVPGGVRCAVPARGAYRALVLEGQAHQPGEHRTAQPPPLAQDLDSLTGPLPGQVIQHPQTTLVIACTPTVSLSARPATGTQSP